MSFMTSKITQRQLAFLLLLNTPKDKYVPGYEFIGEKKISGRYEFLTFKCPARLSELIQTMPNIMERIKIKGESGANYYAYRIIPDKRNLVYIKENSPEEYHSMIYRFNNNAR